METLQLVLPTLFLPLDLPAELYQSAGKLLQSVTAFVERVLRRITEARASAMP